MVSLDCCAMEVMDSSMVVTDGADRGTEETADNSHGRTDRDSIADEDVPHGRVGLNLPLFAEVAILDECVHDRGSAAGDTDGVSPEDSSALADNRCVGPDDRDVTVPRADSHISESDDDCCLEACMTPSGQDYYLRRGGTPRRRSALRLSRIIARQQLLRRLSQGRNRDCCEIFVDFYFFFRRNSLILGPLRVIVHTESRFKQYQL